MLVGPGSEREQYPADTGGSSGLDTLHFDPPGEVHFTPEDHWLIAELRDKVMSADHAYSAHIGEWYLNPAVAERVRPAYSAREITQLRDMLERNGTLDIQMATAKLTVDGKEMDISCMPATELDPTLGEMGEVMYWRDSYQMTKGKMRLFLHDRERHATEGKEAVDELQGYLFAMSTPAQLSRFDYVIEHGKEAGQLDWPNITVRFSDIGGEEPFEWRHKQDSVPMLVDLTLEALQKNFIKPEDLHEHHKELLCRIVPFLKQAGYPRYSSSGSWEEVAAMSRTSVLSVETSLLERIHSLMQSDLAPKLSFLTEGYNTHIGNSSKSFTHTVEEMMLDGLHTIGRQLPHESPDKNQPAVRQRSADATLVYALMYRIPELLVKHRIPTGPKGRPLSQMKIEDMINKQLDTLFDPATGCMARYAEITPGDGRGDSYQRTNWHTGAVKAAVSHLKQRMKAAAIIAGRPEIDLDQKQLERDKLVPAGRQAMWPHPMFQRAAVAAERSLEELGAGNHRAGHRYRRQATHYLNHGLRAVTGDNQHHVAVQEDGTHSVVPTKPHRLPEAIITSADEQGWFLTASPHSPLHWAVATCREATGLLVIATERARSSQLGWHTLRNLLVR
jgi:hypothetical protein